MLKVPLFAIFAAAIASSAVGQAATEWSTARGVPVTVIEVAGGDVVHIAAVVPAETAVPTEVAGFSIEARPTPLGLVLQASTPAFAAVLALGDFATALLDRGAAALVVLGSVPARELTVLAAVLERVPLAASPRRPCLLSEGDVSVVRGTPERLEIALPMPGPEDPRFDLLPALEAWIRSRLAQRWPAVSTLLDAQEGCVRLYIRLLAPHQPPRAYLAPLRRAVQELVATLPTPDEVEAVSGRLERQRAAWAVDGRAAARELVLRRAVGGRVASALAPPLLDANSLAALAQGVLGGRAGEAVLVEAERRAIDDAPEMLENGVLLGWRWVSSAVGTIGVALGGVDPEVGETTLRELAEEASRQGWHVLLDTLAGVPTAALAVPADELPAAMEAVASVLLEASAAPEPPWAGQLAAGLGLSREITGGVVAVAIAAPAEADVVREAAAKFFSSLPPAKVRSSAPLTFGLRQLTVPGEATVLGVVDLPPGISGWLAGEVLVRRLRGLPKVRMRWLAPPGRMVLEVAFRGEGHLPGLDSHVAALWPTVRAAPTREEVAAAARGVLTLLYGDPARAALRRAATPFLPALPTQEQLLAAEKEEVAAALAALPGWEEIPRLGSGPEPLLVTPPPRPTVRQSPPRRPGGAGGGR